MSGTGKVLFVCIHNSARSQIAEAYLNTLAGGSFSAESAGIEPGVLNPVAVEVMREEGIDISGNETKSVHDLVSRGREYDHVITVCDGGMAARCPSFPGGGEREHWAFEDPSSVSGTGEERLRKVRVIRDAIRVRVEEWIREHGAEPAGGAGGNEMPSERACLRPAGGKGGVRVLQVKGDFTVRNSGEYHRVCGMINDDPAVKAILLDFSGGGKVDTAGFACMMNFIKENLKRDVRIGAAGLNEKHMALMELLKIEKAVQVFSDTPEAVEKLSKETEQER